MAFQLLPRTFNQQPQNAAPIDRDNRFGRLVDAGFSFGGGAADLSSRKWATTNTATVVTNGRGRALQFSGGQQFLFTKDSPYNGPYMVVAIVQADTASGGTGNVASGSEAATGYSWQLRYTNSDWEFYQFDGASNVLALDAGGVTARKPVVLVALWDGTNIKLFRDGVLRATTACGAQTRPVDRISLGYDGASAGQFFSGSINDAIFLRGTFTTADAVALSRNIYQALKAPSRRIWGEGAATAPTGTFASTLANAAMSAAGQVTNPGAFATTLGNATMTASGSVGLIPSGTFASTLDSAVMAAAGTISIPGAFASTLAGCTMSATGIVAPNPVGAFASTLDNASMSAAGFVGTPPVTSGTIQRRRARPRVFQTPYF